MTDEAGTDYGTPEEKLASQLAKLDRLIGDDVVAPIDSFQLESARGCVGTIMVELKAHSQLDSILIDRDVRNVIRFVQQTRDQFLDAESTKGKKKVESLQKKTAKAVKLDAVSTKLAGKLGGFSFDGAGKPTGGKPVSKPPADDSDVPSGLDAFARGDSGTVSVKQRGSKPTLNPSLLKSLQGFGKKKS